MGEPVGHLDPDTGGLPYEQHGAAPVGNVPYDVGDQLTPAQLHGERQLRQPPFVEQRAGDAADVAYRVVADGEAQAVLGSAGNIEVTGRG
ncbi:hypothetical protein ADK64_01865 [Streptomyces sp. MMG1121]|nr:hypothetical protein ADK64_01865 [Streptomyces sp. MMG1121]